MNDRRDECVSPFAPSSPTRYSNKCDCSPAGANTPSQSLHLHSVAMQLAARPKKRFRRIRFAVSPSPSSAKHYSRSCGGRTDSLESAEAATTGARTRGGEWSVVGDRIRERLLRYRGAGDGERETKRTEREPSVCVSFFFSLSLIEGDASFEALFTFTYRGCTRFPNRVRTSRVNFGTDSVHHLPLRL